MKKQNLVRNLLMIAFIAGGIFAAGAGNNVYADDTGLIGPSGGRTGYISASNQTAGNEATTSGNEPSRSGYLISGGRTSNTTTTQQNVEESQGFVSYILSFFI